MGGTDAQSKYDEATEWRGMNWVQFAEVRLAVKCVVFYEDWQMECYGTEFSIGDTVKWPVTKTEQLRFVSRAISSRSKTQQAGTISSRSMNLQLCGFGHFANTYNHKTVKGGNCTLLYKIVKPDYWIVISFCRFSWHDNRLYATIIINFYCSQIERLQRFPAGMIGYIRFYIGDSIMVYEFVQSNYVGVVITSFLILFILTNNNFEKKTNRLFIAASFCVLILIVEEAWEAQLAMNTVYTPLRVLLSAIGYALRPMVPYFLVLMVKNYSKNRIIVISIPLIFNVLVSFSSLFCGLSFGYTQDNEFVRGPLGLTPFLIAGFYVVVLLVLTVKECRNGGLVEAMIVSAIVLQAFISTILESLFQFRFIQNPSIATSIAFYYLFLHSNRNNRDTLTGALTRRRFYLDADKHKSTLSAVISLDLNNLKTLNDKYGHIEGDKALITVTAVIKKYMGARSSLYRIGGDEFMILCYKLNETQVQEMIGRIRADLEKTKYRCAIGYALYSNRMKLDRVCQIADDIMYEDKRKMKGGQ